MSDEYEAPPDAVPVSPVEGDDGEAPIAQHAKRRFIRWAHATPEVQSRPALIGILFAIIWELRRHRVDPLPILRGVATAFGIDVESVDLVDCNGTLKRRVQLTTGPDGMKLTTTVVQRSPRHYM